MRFKGKRAVVTGGVSGIGRAAALRLAHEGARVFIGDIDDDGGAAMTAESDGAIVFHHTDVTKDADIVALLGLADADGGLDVLFNNAGAGGAGEPIGGIAAADWDATMALLLRSVALGIRHAAPLMAKRGGGAIVNTSSIAALGSGHAPTAYSTAKAGVLHLTRLAAADLAGDGIRVNAVLPGFIVTDIFTRHLAIVGEKKAQADAAIAHAAARAQPIRRAGTPEDVAAAVAYLASDEAGFVTGTHIVIDGGMTVGTRASWDRTSPSLFEALEAFL